MNSDQWDKVVGIVCFVIAVVYLYLSFEGVISYEY